MKYLKKIIVQEIIIIISCLIFTVSANAAGFIFHWKPFIVDNDLALSNTDKKVFAKNASIFEWSPLRSKMTFRLQEPEVPLKIRLPEDPTDTFALSTNQEGSSTQKTEKKSISENIKINFLSTYNLMDKKPEFYANIDDKQMSHFINTISSLIYDDSKFKSLETIGKIIEPQINFYFEF